MIPLALLTLSLKVLRRDIHLWEVAEHLEEIGILDAWAEQLSDPDEIDVKCEIEFFRQSTVKQL